MRKKISFLFIKFFSSKKKRERERIQQKISSAKSQKALQCKIVTKQSNTLKKRNFASSLSLSHLSVLLYANASMGIFKMN